MEQKFHCSACKNVGGKDGSKYKCVSHKFLCSDCVTAKGFLRRNMFVISVRKKQSDMNGTTRKRNGSKYNEQI